MSLNVTVDIPVDLRASNLAISQDDRTISRVPLPPDQAPLVIPLEGVQLVGDSVTLTMTMTAIPLDDFCWDPLAPIRLVNGSITFTGAEAPPTTVAGFLPPVLRQLTIALPPEPSKSESDAAVLLAATMERRYGAQNPAVVVIALADDTTTSLGPPMPLERQIVVKEGPDKGLSLQPGTDIPALLISGPGNELVNQTRLLADDLLQYALSADTVVTGPLPSRQELLGDSTTLKELNESGLNGLGLWPQVSINVDQTQFGHPLSGVRLHLIGSHTPVPNNFGGEVTATVGSEMIGRWPVQASGSIDQWVDVPDAMLTRVTSVVVGVHTTGDAGACGNYAGMSLSIDGSTQIVSSDANSPGPLGFRGTAAGVDASSADRYRRRCFADTERAAQIVVGLQHMTSVPLDTTVTSLKEAIDSQEPALLISAANWPVTTVQAPFSADQSSVTVTGRDGDNKPVTLTLDPMSPIGSLQTVFDGRRPILVATSNGAPAQLDELLRWLSSKPQRWFGLDGQAVISVPGTDPITVSNPVSSVTAQSAPSSTMAGKSWLWWLAGGLVGIALAGGFILLLGARQRRSKHRSGGQ